MTSPSRAVLPAAVPVQQFPQGYGGLADCVLQADGDQRAELPPELWTHGRSRQAPVRRVEGQAGAVGVKTERRGVGLVSR